MSQQGMTLIEIMVVLAIIGGLMLVLLSGNMLKSNSMRQRDAAIEVMATLRGAYNMATMTGKHHRVVFDLEKQVYHVEVCAGTQTLLKGDEEEVVDKDEFEKFQERLQKPVTSDFNQEIIQAGSPEDAAAAAAALEGLRVGTTRCQPAVNTISGQPSKTGNKHKLDVERKIRISKVHVQHLNDPVEDSIVSINFFPVGSAEKAIVEVEGTDDEVFTILVFGMTSRVEFRSGKVEVNDHMLRDGAGDDAEERE
jgi:prepilin-type N-terminal cleavage/methylation domain-containing protein